MSTKDHRQKFKVLLERNDCANYADFEVQETKYIFAFYFQT